jgi:preprotein translocase subunit YajC
VQFSNPHFALVHCGASSYDDSPLSRFARFDVSEVTQFIYHCSLLAQAPAPGAEDPYAFIRLMGPLVVIMVLFYFMLIRPQKRKEQELRQMVHNLKENDRVVTIGGIHGVVTNVQRDAERVTLRVDEGTGTKLRVNMSAIARVLTGEDQESGTSSAKPS